MTTAIRFEFMHCDDFEDWENLPTKAKQMLWVLRSIRDRIADDIGEYTVILRDPKATQAIDAFLIQPWETDRLQKVRECFPAHHYQSELDKIKVLELAAQRIARLERERCGVEIFERALINA